MKAYSLAAIAALSVALAGPALAAAPLNGGFENSLVDVSPWQATGTVDVLTSATDKFPTTTFTAPEGANFAQLTASETADDTLLSQIFVLDAISTFSFRAAFLAFDDYDHDDSGFVRVFLTDTGVDAFRVDFRIGDIATPYGFTDWTQYGTVLTAVGSSYTVAAGVSNVGGDLDEGYSSKLLLDDVSVAAVPEPATWALMIGGFGLAGGALRRRRALALA